MKHGCPGYTPLKFPVPRRAHARAMGNTLRDINLPATPADLAISIRPDRLFKVAELIEDSVNINIPGAWNRAVINPEWLRV